MLAAGAAMPLSEQTISQELPERLRQLAATPRRVRFCAPELWVMRIFILPHTLVGAGMIILYDPLRPKRNVLLDAATYRPCL